MIRALTIFACFIILIAAVLSLHAQPCTLPQTKTWIAVSNATEMNSQMYLSDGRSDAKIQERVYSFGSAEKSSVARSSRERRLVRNNIFPWTVALEDDSSHFSSIHSRFQTSHHNLLIGDSVRVDWIAGYASTRIPALDYASAIAADESGNIYVTGYSSTPFGFRDYTTIKYSGNQVKWVAIYDGPIADEDYATAITIDRTGNVYVTGTSYGGWTKLDFATVKYDSSGVEQWRARYDGPMHGDDVAVGIAIDEAGNIYVTGYSYQAIVGGYDYTTIKYGSNGIQEWIARYDGPAHYDDYANAIAVNKVGDVYVGGGSSIDSTNSSHVFTLVKYGSDGIERWVSRYTSYGGVINAITLDSSGSIYVTGPSARDVATIKYTGEGQLVWVQRYDGPEHDNEVSTSISVDKQGNVFVGGGSYSSITMWDFLIIMYDSTGFQRWISRYDGPIHDNDGINALAVDYIGGVYVTGLSTGISGNADFATIKYNYDGNAQWLMRYNGLGNDVDYGNGIAVASTLEGVFVTGITKGVDSTGYDYYTVGYSLVDGLLLYSGTHNGLGKSNDDVGGLAVDDSGNVFLSGLSCDNSDCNVYILSYDAGGRTRWETNVPVNLLAVKGLGLDSLQNVFVFGRAATSGILMKLTPRGNVEWIVSTPDLEDFCSTREKIFGVDARGNSYIAGAAWPLMTLEKYNTSGILDWRSIYPDSGSGSGCPTGVAIGSNGDVVMIGDLYQSGRHIATVKFDAYGQKLWGAVFRGVYGNIDERANHVVVDGKGNVYVAGQTSGVFPFSRVFTILKYGSGGALRWGVRDSLLGSDAIRVAVDSSGNVYVTGITVQGATGRSDFVVAKYDSNGNRLWSSYYSGTNGDYEYPTAIAVDAEGDVCITGHVTSLNGRKYATLGYSSLGQTKWVALYERGWSNRPFDIALDKMGNVIVTGHSQVGHWFDAGFVVNTIKYSAIPITGVSEQFKGLLITFSLAQNYPNPFNPSTTIRFEVPVSGPVSLKVFNLLGQEVATLVNGVKQPGRHEVEWDADGFPSGVYFYRLQSGGFVATKKLIIIR